MWPPSSPQIFTLRPQQWEQYRLLGNLSVHDQFYLQPPPSPVSTASTVPAASLIPSLPRSQLTHSLLVSSSLLCTLPSRSVQSSTLAPHWLKDREGREVIDAVPHRLRTDRRATKGEGEKGKEEKREAREFYRERKRLTINGLNDFFSGIIAHASAFERLFITLWRTYNLKIT